MLNHLSRFTCYVGHAKFFEFGVDSKKFGYQVNSNSLKDHS